MLAVSNTSPLHYLVQLDCAAILPQLFTAIAAPDIVISELTHPSAPLIVRMWASSPPPWLELVKTNEDLALSATGLHPGEIGAILLAENRKADFVILDDLHARRIAEARGLQIIGLLGILKRAAQASLIDANAVAIRLLASNFRISPSLVRRELLER